MKARFDYLDDDELYKLIPEVEGQDLQKAPPNFEGDVLRRIESPKVSFEEKQREYQKYRFQVCIAMAAAVLMIIVSPFVFKGNFLDLGNKTFLTSNGAGTNYVSEFLGNSFISGAFSHDVINDFKED
jgi:hypothetical protein